MTSTVPHDPRVPPLPAWAYWTCMALAAALPVLLAADWIDAPWRECVAAVDAALAVLTGTSRPRGRDGR